MSALDQALENFIADEAAQNQYYEEVLNTEFYLPLNDAPDENPENVAPLILEADGKLYMMLFDSEERLTGWAEGEVPYARYMGYQLAELTPEKLHWAINVGSQFSKELVPEEIDWLKQAVAAHRENEA